ncbi:MAG: flippase-like domain-containing protein [Planctomycetes bacterium]|nr:flippase-like domain-containing protein [Planctomycetota bacterium]
MKSYLSIVVKVAIAAALIYFILQQVDFAQIVEIIKGADIQMLFAGTVCWLVLCLLGALRWRWLATAASVPLSYAHSLRLVFIGFFFNNVMFGSTGGDLVRAYMVTQDMTENRWRAVLSVIVDRVIGLFALLSIASAVLLSFEAAMPQRFAEIPGLYTMRRLVVLFVIVFVFSVLVYMSARARRFLRVKQIVSKLPMQGLIEKIHDALSLYRTHYPAAIKAFLVSLPLQLAGISAFYFIATALGSSLSMRDQSIIFPLVQTASAVPIAPAGWGIGEQLYGWFFERFGDTLAIGVAASVLFRLITQIGFGVVGGLVWISSSYRRNN